MAVRLLIAHPQLTGGMFLTGVRKAANAVGVPVILILLGLLLIASCAPLPAAQTPSAPPPAATAIGNAAP
jgi:hypothetical protein